MAGLFDNDAVPDIATVGSNNKLVLYKGDGAGGFTPGNVATLANQPIDITAGHLNNDSRLDLVTSEADAERDQHVNGDGRPDLAMTTTATAEVSSPSPVVMLNETS